MKTSQLINILKVLIVTTIIILLFEIVFSFDFINAWFNNIITNSSGVLFYIIIWIIMFLQVTILNIPAYVILSACASIGVEILSFKYILVVLSAYMLGCVLAYYLGFKFGKKAVKWCAGNEEDYDKWSEFLNKKGKWWYFMTVVFPMFPDDMLCLVAGAMKFDFVWYFNSNLFGRCIGLVTMIITLNFINFTSSNFNFMLIVWSLALIVEIVFYIHFKRKYKNELDNNR